MSLVPDTESAQTGLFLADQSVLLSNSWDHQISKQTKSGLRLQKPRPLVGIGLNVYMPKFDPG